MKCSSCCCCLITFMTLACKIQKITGSVVTNFHACSFLSWLTRYHRFTSQVEINTGLLNQLYWMGHDLFSSLQFFQCQKNQLFWYTKVREIRSNTCSPHCVPRRASNEIDYGKINIKTNSRTTVPTRTKNIDVSLVSSLLTLKRFHTFSQYFIAEFGEVLSAAFNSRDQSTDK